MYQIFTSRAGVKQHAINRWSPIAYWNDACWHRSIPTDTTGLTYLDIGSHAGYYCLRFEQRGGEALGLDFYLSAIIDDSSEFYEVGQESGQTAPHIGQEHDHEEYLWVKREYDASYKVLVGGFDRDGTVVPTVGKVSVVSCLNTLEYLPDQKACVQSMFRHATDRVVVALDAEPEGPSRAVTEPWPLKWVCGLDDIVGWGMEAWNVLPNHWRLDSGDDGNSKWQMFLAWTHPRSKLPPIDPGSSVVFDLDVAETEKHYRATRTL